MTKSSKQKKDQKKKSTGPLYREKGEIRKAQIYYNTSKFVPPVGIPYFWDVKKESDFDENFTDPFGIGFDSKEDMSFLEIQK